jgi:hypothetical protein
MAVAGLIMLLSPQKAFYTKHKPRWLGVILAVVGLALGLVIRFHAI